MWHKGRSGLSTVHGKGKGSAADPKGTGDEHRPLGSTASSGGCMYRMSPGIAGPLPLRVLCSPAHTSHAVAAPSASGHRARDEADDDLEGNEPQDDLPNVLLLLCQLRAGQLVHQRRPSILAQVPRGRGQCGACADNPSRMRRAVPCSRIAPRPPSRGCLSHLRFPGLLRGLLFNLVHAALHLKRRVTALRINARLKLGHEATIIRRRRVEVLLLCGILPSNSLKPGSPRFITLPGVFGDAGNDAATAQLEWTQGQLERVSERAAEKHRHGGWAHDEGVVKVLSQIS